MSDLSRRQVVAGLGSAALVVPTCTVTSDCTSVSKAVSIERISRSATRRNTGSAYRRSGLTRASKRMVAFVRLRSSASNVHVTRYVSTAPPLKVRSIA